MKTANNEAKRLGDLINDKEVDGQTIAAALFNSGFSYKEIADVRAAIERELEREDRLEIAKHNWNEAHS